MGVTPDRGSVYAVIPRLSSVAIAGVSTRSASSIRFARSNHLQCVHALGRLRQPASRQRRFEAGVLQHPRAPRLQAGTWRRPAAPA
jgi:hypothetical protein